MALERRNSIKVPFWWVIVMGLFNDIYYLDKNGLAVNNREEAQYGVFWETMSEQSGIRLMRRLNGSEDWDDKSEFCTLFLDEVEVPISNRKESQLDIHGKSYLALTVKEVKDLLDTLDDFGSLLIDFVES